MFHLGLSWVTSCSLWKGSPALTVLPIHASLLPLAVENCLVVHSAGVTVDLIGEHNNVELDKLMR